MTRERLNTEEIRKMLPVSKVLAGLGIITLGYKAVACHHAAQHAVCNKERIRTSKGKERYGKELLRSRSFRV